MNKKKWYILVFIVLLFVVTISYGIKYYLSTQAVNPDDDIVALRFAKPSKIGAVNQKFIDLQLLDIRFVSKYEDPEFPNVFVYLFDVDIKNNGPSDFNGNGEIQGVLFEDVIHTTFMPAMFSLNADAVGTYLLEIRTDLDISNSRVYASIGEKEFSYSELNNQNNYLEKDIQFS